MALRRIDEGLALPLQRRGAVWWSDPPGYSRVNRSTLAASAGTERMVPVAAWEWYCTRVAAAKTCAIIRQVGLLAPRRTAPSYRGEAGLRQRDISSRSKRMNALWRLLAVVSLAVSLILSLSPLAMTPVVAAPPETIRQATDSSDIAADSGTKTESPPTAEMPQLPDKKDQLSADIAPQDRTDDGDGSVRQRGVEAPVLFEQQTAQGADRPQEKSKTSDKSQKPERDPGDGPVKNSQEPAKKRDLTRAQSGIRIWPMPAKSYTFTQHFGCVPQLGNLYASLEGCPADAPVFHTGIDLAAPEGTPFYAAASGWVILADYDRPTADANTRITIQHDGRNEGYSTDYLHWVASYVEEGDYVHAGDPIGEVGNVGFSTGPHLHFSVTDLGTGEHVDPLRWLPDEPGLEGYVSRKPNARLRLPAGTTAGQPESADPAPPSPAVKEDVPKSPAKDGKRNKQGERIREERHTKASGDPTAGDPAAGDAKRANKKRSGADAASEASVDAPADDATQAPDQTRERKRNKDGAPSEDAAAGENGGPDDSQVDTRNGDRRGNHKESGASDGASQKEPKDDRGKQTPRDPGGHETSGSHDQGGQHDRNPDRQNSDQGGHNGGGHKATANAVDSPETQPLDEPAPTVSPG
jgi:murein DD-endopeptidase MepM/ murein hydrolase activator NlpD